METIYTIIKESKTIYSTSFEVERHSIINSFTAHNIIRKLIGESIEVQEVFYIMILNNKNEVIAVQRMSAGTQNACVVDVRVILKTAIDLLGQSVMLFHNHPSGNLTPSNADKILTNKVKEALSIVDIKLLDHIIISLAEGKYYSMADNCDL